MAATLDDVARKVGCSTATVSRVVNGTGQVAEAMRLAILAAVQEVGYRAPRVEARRREERAEAAAAAPLRLVQVVLHSDQPRERIAIAAGGLEVTSEGPVAAADLLAAGDGAASSFHRDIVDGMLDELGRWGWRALLVPNRDLLDPAFLAELRASPAQGILLTGSASPHLDAFLAACPAPVVLVDQRPAHPPGNPVVGIDGPAGIALAFAHLAGLGHRDIGFLTGREDNFAYRERELAFRACMAGLGQPVREEWIYRGPNLITAASAWLGGRLGRPDRPTALLCSNDLLALGCLRAAASCSVSIPGRLSVVGFDGIAAAAAVTPALTTVEVPTCEMGRQAVRLLMAAVQCPPVAPSWSELRVRPSLVVRASTAPPAG
ncbi:MAG: LacI family transcriptional regulator [Planctomycetes bacterium]|nr:LacI family transcriptional regulator [Planctomycetota bacterium]